MSEVKTETLHLPDDARQRPPRVKVVVHRLDGGLEDGESEARSLTSAGFPIYSSGDSQRARMVPTSDIKYVVYGSVADPTLEPDPAEKNTSRKAILRFRDGEWISAYIDQGVQPDGEGIAIKIRLAELQRLIPAVAASPSVLEMQFVDMWTTPTTPAGQPLRRRSDILDAAARQGRDLNKLANDFRDRLALIRDVGLTTGDTLAFSRAVRTHLDRFLLEDSITLNSQEKSALADIILRAAVGYGPLDSLLHDRSVSEIMVNGPDQVFIERRGVLTKADVRFEDENQLLETIRRMVATTGRHIDGLNPMVDARLPDGSRGGEVRGSEALDMLQAMNTGHDGSMSTIHSNSARDALSRLETMVMMASIDIPFEAVRAQIASAVNLIVHQARMPDGRRKLAQIAEVAGYDSNGALLRAIFLPGTASDLRHHKHLTRPLGRRRRSHRSSTPPRPRRAAPRCSPRRSRSTARSPTSTPDRRWRPPPRWLAPRPRSDSWRPPRADSPACCQPSARQKARPGRPGPPGGSTR